MELAATRGSSSSGGLSLAAIRAVFTIAYVANLLGEDEDWLFDLASDMFPEDGCLWVYGGPHSDGIEYLQQIIADERAAGRALPQVKLTE